jgi:hypothetical protein
MIGVPGDMNDWMCFGKPAHNDSSLVRQSGDAALDYTTLRVLFQHVSKCIRLCDVEGLDAMFLDEFAF